MLSAQVSVSAQLLEIDTLQPLAIHFRFSETVEYMCRERRHIPRLVRGLVQRAGRGLCNGYGRRGLRLQGPR